MANLGLGTWPARRARINPTGVALRQDDRSLTYTELADRVHSLAAALAARGVRQGDRVAYLGPNDIATFEVFFATTTLGAIFAPFNTRLADPEIDYLVSDADPAFFFDRRHLTGSQFDDLVAEGTGQPIPDADVTLADDALILYTSGTTGRPKGAVLTHANLTFNTMNQLAHADVLSSDTALCICPLFHATGLGQVSLPTLFKGGTVVVVPKFDEATVLGLIERLRIDSFAAVPTMLRMLCDHPDFAATDLSSLRYVIYGGSMVAERVAVAWQRRGVPILQGYGMTEASPGVYLAPPDGAAERPVSIGVPHFFTDVTLDDTGELLVRGPNVFRGYWGRPAETQAVFTDGWYRSGDVLRLDDDGWAYVVDRVTDLIISGGENVYPSEVEAAINALPGITDSALIAVPDEQWGEVGAAYVIARDPTWTDDSLKAALRDVIAGFKIPRYVVFVEDLPRTATGKVRKQELRNRGADYAQ